MTCNIRSVDKAVTWDVVESASARLGYAYIYIYNYM